jgi:hypothetical protein
MGSYSTLDVSHPLLEMLVEDIKTFLGKGNLPAVSVNIYLHFRKFLFFSETSLKEAVLCFSKLAL